VCVGNGKGREKILPGPQGQRKEIKVYALLINNGFVPLKSSQDYGRGGWGEGPSLNETLTAGKGGGAEGFVFRGKSRGGRDRGYLKEGLLGLRGEKFWQVEEVEWESDKRR